VDAAVAAAPADAAVVLLHVVDVRLEEALHGAYGALLGRHRRSRDPGDAVSGRLPRAPARTCWPQHRPASAAQLVTRSGKGWWNMR
jgi:hypothetical protein